jgi:hypothetical protein
MTGAVRHWTTPADVLAKLRRKWESGALLADCVAQGQWSPIRLPIHGPVARELAADFEAVAGWVSSWAPSRHRPWRVESLPVGGRYVGVNELPARVWIDSPTALWELLGVAGVVSDFLDRFRTAKLHTPRLVDWMAGHSPKVIALGREWDSVVASIEWIDQVGRPGLYLRHLDVPGVDTKFVERHRALLAELLDLQLSPERIDVKFVRSEFEARYGFARKPQYIRFRPAAVDPRFGGLAEVALRASDFMSAKPAGHRVVIIENDASYLAAPHPADTLTIFGSGHALSSLGSAPWLADREIIYWGDIDTHGFVILDLLRRRWPATRSILMNEETLLAHRGQWVREPTPTTTFLAALDDQEAAFYRRLVEDDYGPSVRLEQERIRFSLVAQVLGG